MTAHDVIRNHVLLMYDIIIFRIHSARHLFGPVGDAMLIKDITNSPKEIRHLLMTVRAF